MMFEIIQCGCWIATGVKLTCKACKEEEDALEEMCQCGQLPAWDDNSVCCKEEEK